VKQQHLPSTAAARRQFTTFSIGIFPSTTTAQQLFTPVFLQPSTTSPFLQQNTDKKLFTPVNNSKFRSTTTAQQLFTTVQQHHLSFNTQLRNKNIRNNLNFPCVCISI
jgi:hypothetical protein